MKHFNFFLLFLLLLLPEAYAQEPVLNWGPAIEKNPRTLQNMHVIGTTDGQSFYAVYTENGQATLERYNENNQRVWATALLPKTPANQSSSFYDVVLLQERLYLLSTFRAKSATTVYAQEISPTGNYSTNVQAVLSSQGNGKLQIAISGDKSMLLATLHDSAGNAITSKLLNTDLQSRWSQTLSSPGTVQQTLLLNNGTAFILAHAPADIKNPFHLHRLSSQDGKPEQLPLAVQEQFKPIQAKLAYSAAHGVLVSGYYAPVAEATQQNPTPKGTFFYSFGNGNEAESNPVAAYTPFNAVFLKEYARYKPEANLSHRLRNLQLRQVLPLAAGGAIVIGEVAYAGNTNGTRTFHTDDIVVVRLSSDGTPVYATSSNKLQNGGTDGDLLNSFIAVTNRDTLHLLYLDFEYNYTAENRIVMAGPGAIEKGPVLVTIPPSGRPLQVVPLHNSQTGRSSKFYLRPASAFTVSNKEVIVMSIGPQHYRYGRLRLN